MTIGIIPNTKKEIIIDVVDLFANRLKEFGFNFVICSSYLDLSEKLKTEITGYNYKPIKEVFEHSDVVVSIGGDGTMLTTAHYSLDYNTPILGLNLGKLGFLAEFETDGIDELLTDLKNNDFGIEERIVLESDSLLPGGDKFYSINDIVVDKGSWPKMIEISMKIDENDVTTFYADGVIFSTPLGSTGYSLSVGGPVVDPKADVITFSPISPHTLTVRPIILEGNQKIHLTVRSNHKEVYTYCDGQRIKSYPPPLELVIYKSNKKVKLIRTNSTNYFKTLREKLFWGLDVRKNSFGGR